MAVLKQLQENGKDIIPVCHTKGVFDDNGRTVDIIISEFSTLIESSKSLYANIDSTDQSQKVAPIEDLNGLWIEYSSNTSISIPVKLITGDSTINLPSTNNIPSIYQIASNQLNNLLEVLILTDLNLKCIKLRNITTLKKFVCNNNKLESLELNNNPSLQYIHILNNPICNNSLELKKLASNLDNREGKSWGSIIVSNQSIRKEVEPFFIKKDWYFGSPFLYNPVEFAKCQWHLQYSGVLDIWESAEYGEGRTIAVLDTGFVSTVTELNQTNFLGGYNCSGQNADQPNFIGPSNVAGTHGTRIATLILGQGLNFYGYVPKAKYYLLKAMNIDGSSTQDIINLTSPLLKKLDVDACNVSLGADSYISDYDKRFFRYLAEDGHNGVKGSAYILSSGNANKLFEPPIEPVGMSCCIGVGGVQKNNTRYTGNSFNGLDFVGYTSSSATDSLYCQSNASDYSYMTGTSGACAVVTGLYTLGYTLFIKKYGFRPNIYEMIEFLKHRTVDMNFDVKQQGYGRINFMAYNTNPKQVIHTTF